MENEDLKDVISRTLSIPTTKYTGDLFHCQRHGKGKEAWDHERCFNRQEYEGTFLYDSLHGRGDYIWNINNQKTYYEGLFYASKLEGYGRISNADNSYFEGLFRRNSRFGPGVFTSADGTQDVGMWYGKNLVRLCVTVKPKWVPRIAYSAKAKVYLLRFKTLVKICNNVIDYAKDVLEKLDASDEVMGQRHKLYNTYVRHPKSIFFDTITYEEKYFAPKDCYIEIADDLKDPTAFELENSTISANAFGINAEDEIFYESFANVRLNDLRNELQRTEEEILKLEEVRNAAVNTKAQQSSTDNDSEVYYKYCQLVKKGSGSFISNDVSNFDIKEYEPANNRCDEVLNAAEDYVKILDIKRRNLIDKIRYEETSLPNVLPKQPTKRVLVTDILAWNNGEISIKMMKYAFLHRNFENTVSFNVAKLLSGNRSEFKSRGKYEEDCIDFLGECSKGDSKVVTDLLIKYDLNPDMCDACGNTGLIFAAARDRHNVIKTLVNFGGNVDVFNDECITPLSLCILRYLSVLYEVSHWEKAFLRTTLGNEEAKLQWRPKVSKTTLSERTASRSKSTVLLDGVSSLRFGLEALSNSVSYPDILEADFNLASVQAKLTNMVPKDLQEVYPQDEDDSLQQENAAEWREKKKTGVIIKQSEQIPGEPLQKDKLSIIHQTIMMLLRYGADPNISEMPLPVLIMSLFTKNPKLVEELLVNNGNPDVRTPEEELTGFHILASLPLSDDDIEVTKILFKYGADPNLTATTQHWPKEKEALVANRALQEMDLGKLPLHLLAMRFDFANDVDNNFSKMATVFIENGAFTHLKYLGHTPLSLAVLRGNTKLVHAFLETGKVNPNAMLGEEMGVPLTILALTRYSSVLPTFADCENILQILTEYGANPFNSTGERGNIIEFMNAENEIVKTIKRREKSLKNTKTKKKASVHDQVKPLLEKITEETLLKHIKGWASRFLYQTTNLLEPVPQYMARFLDVPETIGIIQALFHKGTISLSPTNYSTLARLIEFVINVNHLPNIDGSPPSKNVDIKKLTETFEFKKLSRERGYLNLPQPEVDDDHEKYVVCFYCYRKLNCDLVVCQKCTLVYFCSEKCKMLSQKYKSKTHKCDLDTYPPGCESRCGLLSLTGSFGSRGYNKYSRRSPRSGSLKKVVSQRCPLGKYAQKKTLQIQLNLKKKHTKMLINSFA
ncbi:hypothetical protein FQR65_LT01479 [Abscondita terminalis]|nr:hypothetical protein FQR65_LT01479 [Abscondita terminalis]